MLSILSASKDKPKPPPEKPKPPDTRLVRKDRGPRKADIPKPKK